MKRKPWLSVGIALCVFIFALSAGRWIAHEMEERKSAENMPILEPEQDTEIPETPEEDEEALSEEERLKLENLNKLAAENTDLVGWLSIADTTIDYPVMQTEDDYYLNHDFQKQKNAYGLPYVSKYCDMEKPSDNIIIYGHNIKNEKMFGALLQYKTKEYYEAHPIIQFDTLQTCQQYEIISVFRASVELGSKREFQYYRFIDAATPEVFDNFVQAAKTISLYNIDSTASYGDQLLTLSTCDNVSQDGRFVILAKYTAPLEE